MAEDGNYVGDDDGGLAEREAALKRCALVFSLMLFCFRTARWRSQRL